jgi:C4-dicarboxylate transporter DctM subunit
MLTLLFGVMLLFMFLGMDIGISMGVASLAYILVKAAAGSLLPLTIIPQKMVNGVDSFPLLAVPLFMLMGELMNRGGVTLRLVSFARALVGHITGGLANVVVVTNMIMAGTRIDPVAAAVVGAASTIGPIIPPSIPMILIGSMVDVSVGRMFLGGAIPGVLIGLALMGTSAIIARRKKFPVEPRATWGELLRSTRDAFLALMIPIVVVGAIVSGAATPTEASVVGVWCAFLLGFLVYGELRLQDIPEILARTAVSSGAVMLTVATATVFGWIATSERLGPVLTQWVLSVSHDRFVILFLLQILLLVLGCLMEPIPILVLIVPILFPITNALGINPVHLGVLVTINITIGMLTPPVGLTLFLMSAIGKITILEVTRAIVPFLVVLIASLFVVTYVPDLVLWLPNLVMGAPK